MIRSIFLVVCLTIQSALSAVTGDFSKVASQVTPAVVLIKVETNTRQNGNPHSHFHEQDPYHFFQDDFFRRFFGGQAPARREPQAGQGSGFLVTADGYILTNNHVIKDADNVTAILTDGREFSAKVIGQDPNTDLAVIKIEGENLAHLKLGNSDDLKVGEWVVAIGTPLGLQASLTAGVVSAKGRNNLRLADFEDFIQTDAAINQGNSGGPLLNLEGEVVGINTAIASNTGGYMGIGFAIPSNMAAHVMDQLISSGSVTRGYVGIRLQAIDAELAKALQLDKAEGSLVAEVESDSPAAKAGIQQGDVILELNNQRMESTIALRNAIALKKPGTKVFLKILRHGQPFTKTVELGSRTSELAQGSVSAAKIGLELIEYTPELARRLGYAEQSGVVVKSVLPNSPAYRAGLREGTLIVAVNHNKVGSVQEFQSSVKGSSKGGHVLLLVRQGDIVRYVSLQVG